VYHQKIYIFNPEHLGNLFSPFVKLAADNPTAIESNQTFILQFKVYLRTFPLSANGSKLLSDHRHLDFLIWLWIWNQCATPWRFALGNVFMAPAVRYLPKSLSSGRGMDRLGGGCFESKIWVRGSWGRGQGLGHGLGPTLPHNSLRNSRISTPSLALTSGFLFAFLHLFSCSEL